ncbi:ABC transporter substrate-binding protein [Bradyrhizobium sp. RT5a]|uniref:ABC transporter substrate-binding protein n=1 Tax=unclassified Bradyrhizobium TaxID=2631580 RepID=UPI0033989F51
MGRATRNTLRVLLAGAVALGLTAPAFAEPPLEKTEIRYQGSAGQVTFIELAEDLGYLAPLKLKWVGNTISGPQDIQTVVTGDIDIGGAFYGAILKLIAAKAPVKAVVGYYGSDANTDYGYFVKGESPIKTAHDLIGRKVAVNTLGAHLEFVLREYLARSGLSAGEARQVTLVAIPPVSGEQALRQGQVEVSALGGVLRARRWNGVASARSLSTPICSASSPAVPMYCGTNSSRIIPIPRVSWWRRFRGPSNGPRPHLRKRSGPGSTRSSPSASAMRMPPRSSTGRARALRPRAA